MRKLLGIGAVVAGGVGVLACATTVGVGWWAAARTTAGLNRVAARLDHGLSEIDVPLARFESRLNAIRMDLDGIRGAAETIAAENSDLPRVQAEIERLLDRLVPIFERADTLADSLRSAAAGLRTVTDIVYQLAEDSPATDRVRSASEKIESAAVALNGLRARVEALRSAKVGRLAGELGAWAREGIAGSELLAEGLAAARQEIVVVRGRTVEWRDEIVGWFYVAAAINTLVWLWGGLGQLCLIGWGRRRFDGNWSPPPVRKDDGSEM